MKLTQRQIELINKLIELKILEREEFKRALIRGGDSNNFVPEMIEKVNQQLVE